MSDNNRVTFDDISQEINKMAMSAIKSRAEKKAPEKKEPKNRAALAYYGFNFTMFVLDVITGITVGWLIRWYFGFMVMLAGVLSLYLHESLILNPFGRKHQKIIAGAGAGISICSTLFVGVIASVLSVMQFTGYFSLTTALSQAAIDGIMVSSLVISVFIHGILWGAYYFSDPEHIAQMKLMILKAERSEHKQNIANAKSDVADMQGIMALLLEHKQNKELGLILESFKQQTGKELIVDDEQEPVPARSNGNGSHP